MNINIGDKELELNVKLGVTIKIRKKFNKPFNQVLSSLDKMDIDDYIKLLYCGVKEDEMSLEDFRDLIYDNLGMMELYELIEKFIKKIQYPGLTEEEIDRKLDEKNQKALALKNMIGLNE